MGNVFMTVVGAGNYYETEYKLGEDICTNRFVQKSLLTMLKRKGENFDRIVFFLTDKAKEDNWEEYRRVDFNKNEITDEGLKPFLEREFPDKFEVVDINNAGNDEEILELFNKMYDSMAQGDEITFDVTHGFRSIPFLFYPVMSYAKEIKSISIKHIYYGSFIEKGQPADIIDLQKYDEILEWANAVQNFRLSGNATQIAKLSQKRYDGFVGKEKITFNQSNLVAKAMLKMTDALMTSQCGNEESAIRETAKHLKKRKEKMTSSEINQDYVLFDEILRHAFENVRCFSEEKLPYEIGLDAVKWYKERSLFQQAYTSMVETLVTYLCNIIDVNRDCCDTTFRDSVNSALNDIIVAQRKGNSTPEQPKNPDITYIKTADLLRGIDIQFYKEIKDMRNKMNHFGMNVTSHKAINSETLDVHCKALFDLIDNIESKKSQLLTDEQAREILKNDCNKSNVFVNFSNHPSANWGEEQINAVNQLVTDAVIADVPFPQVTGTADETEIAEISEKCVELIMAENPSAVMCQGEFGVCFDVIGKLKNRGVKVVYSCSERCTVEKITEKGAEKTSVFRFVRFREF